VILPDVNVLVHAFRGDTSDHVRCHSWLDGVVNGESRYGMSPQVLSAVVRITTHPKVFKRPSNLEEVLRFAELLLGQPQCVPVQPGDGHWRIFTRLCLEADARGQPRARRLVRGDGNRGGMRMGDPGPRLLAVPRAEVPPAGLSHRCERSEHPGLTTLTRS
jgi:hypothetical protein